MGLFDFLGEEFSKKREKQTQRVDCKTIDELVVHYDDAVKRKWIIRGCEIPGRMEIGFSVMNAEETVIYSIRYGDARDLLKYLRDRGDSLLVYGP